MYNECITCPKLGVSCDGPNFVAMSAMELLNWCKQRKKHLDISNAELAELSGTPKGTIDRLLSGEHMDFRYETMRPLVKALVGAEWSGIPCPDVSETDASQKQKRIEQLEHENSDMRTQMEHMQIKHEEELSFMRHQCSHEQEAYDTCKKALIVVSVLLGIAVCVIIAALIVDIMREDRGFFWMASVLSVLLQ